MGFALLNPSYTEPSVMAAIYMLFGASNDTRRENSAPDSAR
jgi:hypothetical protein